MHELRESMMRAWISQWTVGDIRLPRKMINEAVDYAGKHLDTMIIFNPKRND